MYMANGDPIHFCKLTLIDAKDAWPVMCRVMGWLWDFLYSFEILKLIFTFVC